VRESRLTTYPNAQGNVLPTDCGYGSRILHGGGCGTAEHAALRMTALNTCACSLTLWSAGVVCD